MKVTVTVLKELAQKAADDIPELIEALDDFEKEVRELYEDDVNYISKKDAIKEILGK